MMKKTVPVLLLAVLTFSATAVQSPQNDKLEIQGEISQEDKNFYPGQRTVEFPAVKSGEETVRYSNASYEEYVSWQLKDEGLEQIRSKLKSDLSLKGIRSASGPETIEITYIVNDSIERNYSYQELQKLVPAQVIGSYEINGETVNTSVDVTLEKEEAIQESLDYGVARSTESFGSSSGENYNASFKVLGTKQGEHTGEQVKDVSVSENSISFTGYLEAGQPCDKINRTYERKDSELVLKVDTYSTGEPCTDVIAFKKYSFDLESEKPVRLEVRHNGQEVRTLETPETHTDDTGVIAGIFDFIQNIF